MRARDATVSLPGSHGDGTVALRPRMGVVPAATVTGGPPRRWLLFDGDCNFCRRGAAWVTRHDQRGRLTVIAYQAAPAPPMTCGLRVACAEALHLVTARGRTYRGGDACIAVLGALGWQRLARFLARPPLRRAIGLGYRLVAANRARLWRPRSPACGEDWDDPRPRAAGSRTRTDVRILSGARWGRG